MSDNSHKSAPGFRKRGRITVIAVVILIVAATVTIELSNVVTFQVHRSLMTSLAERSVAAFQRELGALVAPLQGQLGITEKWGERGVFELFLLFLPHWNHLTLYFPIPRINHLFPQIPQK